jgi:hypothetical protein
MFVDLFFFCFFCFCFLFFVFWNFPLDFHRVSWICAACKRDGDFTCKAMARMGNWERFVLGFSAFGASGGHKQEKNFFSIRIYVELIGGAFSLRSAHLMYSQSIKLFDQRSVS